jgi:hypothetical protein
VRIIRRGGGSVVTWRRPQMVLLSARGMDVAAIAKVALTSDDRARDVIRNFNADGSGCCTRSTGGRAPKFTLAHRRESKKIARSTAAGHDLAVLNLEPAGAGGVPQPDAALAAVPRW